MNLDRGPQYSISGKHYVEKVDNTPGKLNILIKFLFYDTKSILIASIKNYYIYDIVNSKIRGYSDLK